MHMDIRFEDMGEIHLVGYKANTRWGLYVIPRLWGRLHRMKRLIQCRSFMEFVVGLDMYHAGFRYEDNPPSFDYYAAVEVEEVHLPDPKMQSATLPARRYAVFAFRGKSQYSLLPAMQYIYLEWLPQSGCKVDPDYDFTRYGEAVDSQGQSVIEIWVPLLS